MRRNIEPHHILTTKDQPNLQFHGHDIFCEIGLRP